MRKWCWVLIACLTLCAGLVRAETVELPPALRGIKIGALWYLDYRAGKKSRESYNHFSITRGYINIKKKITPWLRVRVTPDITRTSNGDVNVRIKYLYARLYFPDLGFITNNFIEFGQIHFPWLDFKEAVNGYRCQGTMLQERNHIFNSADQGIAWFGYFGGEMPKEYKEKVDKHYAGRYGSFSLGVFNGSGYHAGEKNNNKALEGRITIRPLPDIFPGLQLSYFGIYGKGNLSDDPSKSDYYGKYGFSSLPDWWVNTFYVSYEAPLYTWTFTYARDKGCQSGKDEDNKQGFSWFARVKMPFEPKIEVIGRYDIWDPNLNQVKDIERRVIAGVSYRLYKNNLILLDYEKLFREGNQPDDYFIQTVLQISF
ncbi:MAG: hypothetical protein LWW94_10110 [Candidatus Desulfofervidaceae bacterium]|nr:hypothetical protein [Candidatus Desulfofervidaceae bacterium]